MKNPKMLMSILDELGGVLDDSIMEDVAKAKPTACITIKITGPKGMVAAEGADEETEAPDQLDKRLASVSRGRSAFDKAKS